MTVVEVLVDQLEAKLDQVILENLAHPDFAGANLALDAIEKKLDQAMIYDKTIRTRLEAELRQIRSSIQDTVPAGLALDARAAKSRLDAFRGSFQTSFRAGDIL